MLTINKIEKEEKRQYKPIKQTIMSKILKISAGVRYDEDAGSLNHLSTGCAG